MKDKMTVNWKIVGPTGLALMGIIVLAIGCAGGGGTAPVPQPISPNGLPLNSISVVGYGEATGTPDIATVQLGFDVKNADLAEAVADSNQIMDEVMKAVTGQGVEAQDIKTTGYNVWPEDIFDPQTGMPTGERTYHVQNTISIKVRDLSKVSAVIEAALNAGANQVYGLSFGVDDTGELEATARTNAVADARARAEQLAAALGMEVGKAIIVADSYSGGGPIYADQPAGGFGGGGGPAISEGQLTIAAQVSIIFELK